MNIKCEDTIIGNVSDYLLWVKETNKAEVISDEGQPICFENNNIYYRGQSCSCWELKPSVFREPILDEHSLLNKASLKLWNEVSSLRTHLEKMIFFQHYGLCTRLLDVTFNPLVALYMACCEEKWNTCDGVVFCGYSVERRNDKIAELIREKNVDVAPVRHGRWEKEYGHYKCLLCNGLDDFADNYCPNCGARMDDDDKWEE